jgi:aromatic ring-opening dioxygenase catalytic subunit (LigB family)
MAKIVCAMAVIHGPRATGAPETAAPEKAQQVWDGFDALRRELEETSPDWALLITNDHLTNPFFPYVAPMVLGTAPSFRSVPEESARLPEMVVPSDEAVSAQMLDAVWEAGVDLGYSYDLLLDHGSTVPLHFLTPRLDLPIVHIHQMVSRGPRPPLQRCYTLGGALRQFVDARPASERVAVIATGGLSHWVGGPQMGQVNPAWDQWVLRRLEERADAELLAMNNADIEEQAGNGAHEIRNWITLLGTVPGAPAEVVSYVDHIPSWAQSTAHVRFQLQ